MDIDDDEHYEVKIIEKSNSVIKENKYFNYNANKIKKFIILH